MSRLAAAALLVFLLLPLAALVLATSPADLAAGLANPLVWPALRLSVFTTLASTAAVVLLGTPLAWQVARRPGRLARAVETLTQLPVVIPPAVAGVALLLAFGRRDLLGTSLPFTSTAVVMAQAFVSTPFYLGAATAAFRRLDERMLAVARSLGAGPARVFFRVALPLSLSGLAAGCGLAWARALGEFGATLMFAGNLPGRTQTLPLAIYAALESDVRAAKALSLVLVAVALVLLLALRLGAPVATTAERE